MEKGKQKLKRGEEEQSRGKKEEKKYGFDKRIKKK